jgi:drug/metabolite transporter (DMT)-like permease
VTRRDRAIALQALLALIWGVHWVVVKVGLEYIPPFSYAALRVGSAAVVMAVFLGARGRIRRPPRGDLPVLLAVGLGQIAAQIALMNLALLVLPAGRSSILLFTMPLWVVLIQTLVLRRPPARREIAGLALGLLGVGLLLSPASLPSMSPSAITGVAMLLGAAIIWASTLLLVRSHHWQSSTLDLLLWELLVACVPLAALALVADGGRPASWGLPAVAVILFSGPIATAFGYWASVSIQRTSTPTMAAAGFLAVPVVGLASGALLLGEPFGPVDVAAAAIALTGVAIVLFAGSRGGGPTRVEDAGALPESPATFAPGDEPDG